MNEIEKGYELIRRVENKIVTHELAFAENTKALLKIVKQLKADKRELVEALIREAAVHTEASLYDNNTKWMNFEQFIQKHKEKTE